MPSGGNQYRCQHGSFAPDGFVEHWPSAQAGAGRHKCAVCAYSRGYGDMLSGQQSAAMLEPCRHGNRAPVDVLSNLPTSQAGPDRERHKYCTCAYSEGAAVAGIAFQYPDDVSSPGTFQEGRVKTVTVNAYERNPQARQRCIEHFGYKCCVCDFDFELRYGPAGRDLIHVHHLRPLASIGRDYCVDPVKDLRPICPNCHAMIHRREPPYTIEDLRVMLRASV